MNPLTKIRFKKENPINWKTQNCMICRLPLKVGPTNFKTPDDEMSYGDFVIRYEHKFLKKIYTYEQIKDSCHIIKFLENILQFLSDYWHY